MKRTVLLFILFIAAFSPAVSAQQGSGEKLISVDSTSLTFDQYESRLYCNPSGGFKVTWKDTRSGPVTSYGQDFDRNGIPTEKNSPMVYHDRLSVGNNGAYFTLTGDDVTYDALPNYHEYFLYARAVNPGSDTSKLFLVNQFSIPFTARNYLGFESQLIAHNDGDFSVLLKRNQTALLRKYNSRGNLIKNREMGYIPATDAAAAVNKNGNYVVFFKLVDLDKWGETDSPLSYVAKFFDAADSLVADSIIVLNNTIFPYIEGSSDNIVSMAVVPVQDSLFQFMAVDKAAGVFHFSLFDRSGKKISDDQSVALQPQGTTGAPKILNLNASNMTQSGYSVVIASGCTGTGGSMLYYFSCLKFDASGKLSEGPVHIQVTRDEATQFGTGLFRDEQGYLYTAFNMDHDIFLNKYSGTGKAGSVKVNDDTPGVNQVKTVVVQAGRKGYFVMWEEEGEICGRYADKDGNASGPVYHPANKSVDFLPDGSGSISAYKKKYADYSAELGFYIYDENFNINRHEQLIKLSPEMEFSGSAIRTVVLDDSSFAVAYSIGEEFHLQLRGRSGGLIRTVSGVSPERITAFGLYRESGNTIAIKTNLRLQTFDHSLDSLSSFNISEGFTYLKNGISIKGDYSMQPPFDFVYELRSSLSSFYASFSTGRPVRGKQYAMLDSSRAIAVFWSLDRYYYRTFSLHGDVFQKDEMQIYDMTGSERDMSFAANGGSILFAWAEQGAPGNGYDIFARSMRISDVTGVEEGSADISEIPQSYSLKQNYPNPFNPVTRIEYTLPEECRVSLIVYDMLGREVKRIVDGIEAPGSHSVSFDASSLSSGIYFYTLFSDNGTKLTRKMIIMK